MENLTFEKIEIYDLYNNRAKSNGMVTEWVARNEFGNVVGFGYTKAECVKDVKLFYRIKQNGLI